MSFVFSGTTCLQEDSGCLERHLFLPCVFCSLLFIFCFLSHKRLLPETAKPKDRTSPAWLVSRPLQADTTAEATGRGTGKTGTEGEVGFPGP